MFSKSGGTSPRLTEAAQDNAALSDWQSYSRSLVECGHASETSFVCPICKVAYLGPTKPSSVSKGHIIPAAFGGELTVLVCSQCEGYMGHNIEAPLINLVKDGRVIYGRTEGIVRGRLNMRTDSGPARVHLRFKSEGWEIHLPKRGDGERAFPNVEPGPITKAPRLEFALEFDKQKVDRSLRLTVLKAAYLASFKWLGYAYALRDELAWVGRKLRGQPVRRPYVYVVDPPGKSYTISMPSFKELASHPSHVALAEGTAAELPVLFAFVQLQNMQYLAVLPPPSGGVNLDELRNTFGTGEGRKVIVTFDLRRVVVAV